MASGTKINKFVLNLAQKVFNLGSDTLKVALTNSAPTASTANQLSDITEISYTNCSARGLTISSSTQTSGTYKLVIADLVLTASGTVGPFRYVVIYDDTATNDELIAYYDYGSAVTLANGDTFTLDFDGTNGLLQIA
jgi:hypothetical protein